MYTCKHNLNAKQNNSELKSVQLHVHHTLGKLPENLGNYEL